MKHLHILKRKEGHKELFDEHKLKSACYRACLNAHLSDRKSKDISKKVCEEIKFKLKKVKSINAEVLNQYVVSILKKYDEDAGYLFETHYDVN